MEYEYFMDIIVEQYSCKGVYYFSNFVDSIWQHTFTSTLSAGAWTLSGWLLARVLVTPSGWLAAVAGWLLAGVADVAATGAWPVD